MKRTLIDRIPDGVPYRIESLISGRAIYDSSCSPEARVYFIDKDEGLYLKRGKKGSLCRERLVTEYFGKKGIGAHILEFEQNEYDWMLSKRVSGEDCTHSCYLENPERLAELIGVELRKLHEADFSDCPINDRMGEYISLVEENFRTGNYDSSHFPDSFGYRSADEAIRVFESGKNELKNEVLIHGDYCLPNIMLDNWSLSGFIDVGNGGIGDRHVDLFWGAWTLGFNLGTDEYRERFFDAYGRDKIDGEKLKIIAAAEVFG